MITIPDQRKFQNNQLNFYFCQLKYFKKCSFCHNVAPKIDTYKIVQTMLSSFQQFVYEGEGGRGEETR